MCILIFLFMDIVYISIPSIINRSFSQPYKRGRENCGAVADQGGFKNIYPYNRVWMETSIDKGICGIYNKHVT